MTFLETLFFFKYFSPKYRNIAIALWNQSISVPTKCAQKYVFFWTTDSSWITFVLVQSCTMQRKSPFPPIVPHIDKHHKLHCAARRDWRKPAVRFPSRYRAPWPMRRESHWTHKIFNSLDWSEIFAHPSHLSCSLVCTMATISPPSNIVSVCNTSILLISVFCCVSFSVAPSNCH